MAFKIEHNGTMYNSLFDDILYVLGTLARTISRTTFLAITSSFEYYNQKGIRMNMCITGISLSDHDFIRECGYRLGSTCMYIREPEDPNQKMVIEKEVIKEVFVDKVVDKIVHVAAVTEMDQLEDCVICYESKGYISSDCCSLRQCLKCAVRMCEKKSCPQCRRNVTFGKLNHTLFPTVTQIENK